MTEFDDSQRRPLTFGLTLFGGQPDDELSMGAQVGPGPTSPPETPTPSRHEARTPSHTASDRRSSRSLAHDASIRSIGRGHRFGYRRSSAAKRLSPEASSSSLSSALASSPAGADGDKEYGLTAHHAIRGHYAETSFLSFSSSDADGSDDEDDEDDGSDGDESDVEMRDEEVKEEYYDQDDRAGMWAHPPLGVRSTSAMGMPTTAATDSDAEDSQDAHHRAASSIRDTLLRNFVIEDVDPLDSGCEGLEILHPAEIESNHSRSGSRHKEFDRGIMRDFGNLNCRNDHSDEEAPPVAAIDAETVFYQYQKERRRMRRVSMSSSLGKRTHSERSDSDECDAGTLDVNDVGSSARRMRKRLHRGSLLFQDPPAPRIDELEEPDSEEDAYATADPLARELPYWTLVEIMEMDSA